MWPSCIDVKKKFAVCADLLFCLLNLHCFFDVFVAVAVVVATAACFDLKEHSVMTLTHRQIQNVFV